MIGFELKHKDNSARAGRLHTAHGAVDTPCFMPVATNAGVKTLSPEELDDIGIQAVISNAFVLYLKPGVEVVKKAGGLHRFMNFDRTIFTDSGGFQMLKEDFLDAVSRKGIVFKSPYDDSRHIFTPEKCMDVQEMLGSDVAMVLDDCPPYGSGERRVVESVKRTADWALRCKEAHTSDKQMLFGIIQGGVYKRLREKNAQDITGLDFDGYGIGGLSIGEPRAVMFEMLGFSLSFIPEDRPRYFMGLGSPAELLESISMGVDIFDSAFPTRNARHNAVYTREGKYNITKGRFKDDFGKLEEGCNCYACRNFTRSYISHLMRVYETFGMRLVTIHNLHFITRLLKNAREAIKNNEFEEFKGFIEGSHEKI